VEQLHPDDRQVAREVQQENRSNAYLFRATLNWIQDTMEFFGRKTVPVTYSQSGLSQTRPSTAACFPAKSDCPPHPARHPSATPRLFFPAVPRP
jgi:hypothetical protein